MSRAIRLFGERTPTLGNDNLALLQKLIAYCHCLTQQTTGIAAQIKYQPIHIAAEVVERIGKLAAGRLLEIGDVHITDIRPTHGGEVDAVGRNLVPDTV